MVSAASPLVNAPVDDESQQDGRKNFYARHSRGLRQELAERLSADDLRALHQVSTARHLAVTAAQFGVMALATWGLIVFTHPLIWIPLSVIQGFVIFNFTVMLHEVVHDNAIRGGRSRSKAFWNKALGFLYAVPSGISRTQFTRWHLDHHDSLGSEEDDPKRHHLSPKVNRRWYKLLYFTPALIFIYFRAAKKETATYPPQVQRKIRNERLATIAIHAMAFAALAYFFGWAAAGRAYLAPYLLVFPVAFALNRLCQHYFIVPEDPAQWSTLMKVSRFWDIAYLWSTYHLEHHYYPRVPFYNMPKLRRKLEPFFEERGMKDHSIRELLYHYIVLNKRPHTDWSLHLD
ncbi:MAG TPA: fatty acid desaturase [Acidobacteriota bacterium]|nr:fatty acid desaturase [Acidobacteriota bacterium]